MRKAFEHISLSTTREAYRFVAIKTFGLAKNAEQTDLCYPFFFFSTAVPLEIPNNGLQILEKQCDTVHEKMEL